MDVNKKFEPVKVKKRRKFSLYNKRKLCEQWKASGLNKNKFCIQNQLAISVFSKWCNKLLPNDNKELKDDWIPVVLSDKAHLEQQEQQQQMSVEIMLPNKMVVRLSLALTCLDTLLKELCNGSTIIRQ